MIFGPLPANNLLPKALPSGIPNSPNSMLFKLSIIVIVKSEAIRFSFIESICIEVILPLLSVFIRAKSSYFKLLSLIFL
ncbi:MAG: hypothetical protein A2Y15_08205 [Clostridiales bacterium GWF2_36_10]|nr:MAG: hypothetical protein A2Y15_08205 [Clostridiales bacterium GWF2_36_10]